MPTSRITTSDKEQDLKSVVSTHIEKLFAELKQMESPPLYKLAVEPVELPPLKMVMGVYKPFPPLCRDTGVNAASVLRGMWRDDRTVFCGSPLIGAVIIQLIAAFLYEGGEKMHVVAPPESILTTDVTTPTEKSINTKIVSETTSQPRFWNQPPLHLQAKNDNVLQEAAEHLAVPTHFNQSSPTP